jgi:8-oxo-dGTP pyrophosphatase MutT (NUDIX family)
MGLGYYISMRNRPSVGLVALDEMQRILLFHIKNTIAVVDVKRPTITTWWGPPGGGVEGSETFEEAGIRELWEETGIEVRHLGPWVWTYERTIEFPDEVVRFSYRYFVVNVQTTEVNISNLLEEERAIYRAHRWWTIDQIEQSEEVFLPPGLPQLLRPIILGKLPSQPIFIQ